ncbi:MAG: LapA family protein [Nitrospinae bacterium]|nr:LapA family protein [Nitrospinota bacterium]
MMITIILILITVAIVSLFSVQNAGPVVVSFLVWRFEASLAIVIVLCMLAGISIGVVIASLARRKTVRERKIQDKPEDVKEIETEK